MSSIETVAERSLRRELDAEPSDAASLKEYLRSGAEYVYRRRVPIFRIAAIGLVLSTIGVLLIPNRYESTASIMPPDSHSDLGSLGMQLSGELGMLGALAGGMLDMKNTGAVMVGVLQSRAVQDHIIEKFKLQQVYGVRYLEDARHQLADRSTISQDRKTGIITLAVRDHDPNRAAAIASAYLEELSRLINDLNTSSARRERLFLEDRIKTVKAELDTASKDFSQFASKNTAIDIKEQGRAMVGAAAALQGQLIVAETELQGLKQIYTDDNIRVRAAEARIAELNRQVGKLSGEPGQASKSGSQSIPSIRELPLLGVPYADLYREVKVQETVYALLTQQYEMAKVQEAKAIPVIKILDPPDVPERKSFPPRTLFVALGAVFSFALAVGCVRMIDSWRDTSNVSIGSALVRHLFGNVGHTAAADEFLPTTNRKG